MGGLLHDLRYAARMLGANARFTAAAVLTLALGIGATAAIFSVVNQVLLRPLPYNGSEEIYRIRTIDAQGLPGGAVMAAHVDSLNERRGPVLAAAYGFSDEASVVGRDGLAVTISEYFASEEFFRIFTDPPSLGRGFEPGDDSGATVLGHRLWREQFESDPNIVGSVVRGRTIVGVAAPDFDFPAGTGAWTKFVAEGQAADVLQMDGYARLAPGAAGEELQAVLDVVAGTAAPWQDGRPVRFVSVPLLEDVVGSFSSTVLILSGAVAILLLIACLNVAILLFTRGAARARELALRGALGAGRWRVIRQLLTETSMLAVLGGTLGLGLAAAAVRLFGSIAPEGLPRLQTLALDQNVLLFAAACVVLTTFAVGLAPAVQQARGNLNSLINEGGRSASSGPSRNRLFGTLVIAEVALAVVLVIGAALLVLSYINLVSRDPGFNPDRLLTVELNVPGRVVDTETGTGYLPVARFYENLMDRLRALPGVESVGATSHVPLIPPLDRAPFLEQGEPFNPRDPSARPVRQTQVTRVSPEYFESMGTRPVAGRLFEPSDGRAARGAAVVNESFVRFVYPNGNAVGQRLILPGIGFWQPGGLAYGIGEMATGEFDVVGVVPDIPQSTLWETPEPAVYFPFEQWTVRRMTLVVRTQLTEPGSLVPAIRAVLGELDPTIPPEFTLYADVLSAAVARERLGAALLGAFGLASLLLAAVGIYGLMSYSVAQRSTEIAVRSALGARSNEMSRMIVAWALRLALAGTALGLGGAWAIGRIVASQLYEISAFDPMVFVSVPLTILAVAIVSSYLPARRAARIDPALTLRAE